MVPPYTTDLVEHWFEGMAVLEDDGEREIRGYKTMGQGGKGNEQGCGLPDGGADRPVPSAPCRRGAAPHRGRVACTTASTSARIRVNWPISAIIAGLPRHAIGRFPRSASATSFGI